MWLINSDKSRSKLIVEDVMTSSVITVFPEITMREVKGGYL